MSETEHARTGLDDTTYADQGLCAWYWVARDFIGAGTPHRCGLQPGHDEFHACAECEARC